MRDTSTATPTQEKEPPPPFKPDASRGNGNFHTGAITAGGSILSDKRDLVSPSLMLDVDATNPLMAGRVDAVRLRAWQAIEQAVCLGEGIQALR